MADPSIFLRRWCSRIRMRDESAYVAYVTATGLEEYRATPGNLGCQILLRTLADGSTEVTTLSWWDSIDAIRGFAGVEIDLARYYAKDDEFLLEKPERVEHHRVAASQIPAAIIAR